MGGGGKPNFVIVMTDDQRWDSLWAMPFVDEIVVATTREASDDPIAALVESRGHRCVRGPVDDVLARFVVVTCGRC